MTGTNPPGGGDPSSARRPDDPARGSGALPILLASATSALAVIPVWLIGGLAVEIRSDLSFTESQLGLVTGAFMAVSAALSIPGGIAIKRWGSATGVASVTVITGAACLGVALLAGDWIWLLLFLGIAGIGHAVGQPTANLVLVESVPARRQGVAFGIKQSSIPIGTMLSGVAVPLVGVTLGWRWAFGAVVVACALLAGLAGLGARRVAHGDVPPRKPAGPIEGPARRRLLLLSMAGGFGTAASNTLGAFTVVYAATLGLSSSAGGVLLAVGSVANIVTRLVLGHLADRRTSDHLLWVGAMMILGAAGFTTMAFAPTAPILVLGVVLAFVTAWGWNGLYHLALMRRYRDSAASATGVVSTFLSIGGTLGPIAFGVLAERGSFTLAWVAVAATTAVAGVLITVGARLGPPVERLGT